MATVDKAAMLKRIAGKPPAYDDSAVAGAPMEETAEGELSCGEQLKIAIDSGDVAGIDAALREAVQRYK